MFLEADDLAAMAANGMMLVPTMSVWDALLSYTREMQWSAERRQRIKRSAKDHMLPSRAPLKLAR